MKVSKDFEQFWIIYEFWKLWSNYGWWLEFVNSVWNFLMGSKWCFVVTMCDVPSHHHMLHMMLKGDFDTIHRCFTNGSLKFEYLHPSHHHELHMMLKGDFATIHRCFTNGSLKFEDLHEFSENFKPKLQGIMQTSFGMWLLTLVPNWRSTMLC